MAISPLKHHYHHLHHSTMPFTVNDILHHQALLSGNGSGPGVPYGNQSSHPSSFSASSPICHLDDTYTQNKKFLNSNPNSSQIIGSQFNSHLSNFQANNQLPRSNATSSSSHLIAPCTPSPSLHSPTNSYNAPVYSFSSTPNTFNDHSTAAAAVAAAYLNGYSTNNQSSSTEQVCTGPGGVSHLSGIQQSPESASTASLSASSSPPSLQFSSQYQTQGQLNSSESIYGGTGQIPYHTSTEAGWYNAQADTRLASKLSQLRCNFIKSYELSNFFKANLKYFIN